MFLGGSYRALYGTTSQTSIDQTSLEIKGTPQAKEADLHGAIGRSHACTNYAFVLEGISVYSAFKY